MYALRAHINYLFLEKFYAKLKKLLKKVVTFSFFHKSFIVKPLIYNFLADEGEIASSKLLGPIRGLLKWFCQPMEC